MPYAMTQRSERVERDVADDTLDRVTLVVNVSRQVIIAADVTNDLTETALHRQTVAAIVLPVIGRVTLITPE